MNVITRIFMVVLLSHVCVISCGGSGSKSVGETPVIFDTATVPGQVITITVGSESVDMIYASNQTSITFPYTPSSGIPVDDNKATLTRKFFMSETQVSNALMVEVLQWAVNNGKIIETGGAHNEVSGITVKFGCQELLDLDGGDLMKISYNSATHTFSVVPGFEHYPVVYVSWYGAVMFCNWLTEMQTGNEDNVVYGGIPTDGTAWVSLTHTTDNPDKKGYRLPSSEEWEYAARYIGTEAPAEGELASEYITQSVNGGHADLTAGYFWTPADYASGAIRDYASETETRVVAWYWGNPDMGGSDNLMPCGQKVSNKLGLYDMNGNVWVWCFTWDSDGGGRIFRGGSWNSTSTVMQIGQWSQMGAGSMLDNIGFRFTKTQ